MGNLNSIPAGTVMPLKMWGGEQGQRLARAQRTHARMVEKACRDEAVSSARLKQLIKRYDVILLAAVKVVPR